MGVHSGSMVDLKPDLQRIVFCFFQGFLCLSIVWSTFKGLCPSLKSSCIHTCWPSLVLQPYELLNLILERYMFVNTCFTLLVPRSCIMSCCVKYTTIPEIQNYKLVPSLSMSNLLEFTYYVGS